MSFESFYSVALSALPLLFKGALITIKISAFGIVIGIIFGGCLGVLNSDELRSKYVGKLINTYVTIMRGTPIFVQLLIVYFAFPETFGLDFTPQTAGILTLGLNSTAYLSETMRGGINAVPKGQWEGALTLGYNRFQTLQYIILPQAIKNVLPAITNEFANLIKDSSILMVIGVPELIKTSKDIVSRELKPMEIYLMAAMIYLLITTFIASLTKYAEKRLK